MVAGTYYNVTTAVGVVWFATSSTLATAATFSIEGQSSTNQLLVRNIHIPNTGTTGFGSTDLRIGVSTQIITVASSFTESKNSFHYLISGSVLTMYLVNNSGSTTIYHVDGEVIRV